MKQAATIRRLLNDDQLEVAGFLKMRISTADIEEVLPYGRSGAEIEYRVPAGAELETVSARST